MKLQTLHPDRDESLYREAWQWRATYPKSVQRWDMVKGFDEWMQMMRERISIAAIDGNMFALVTLEPTGKNVYEVHLDCERRPSIEDLLWAILSIQKQVFEELKADEVFVGVIRRNVGVLRLITAIGFEPDGIEETRGRIKWVRLRQTRESYVLNKNKDDNSKSAIESIPVGPVQYREHVRAFAGSGF